MFSCHQINLCHFVIRWRIPGIYYFIVSLSKCVSLCHQVKACLPTQLHDRHHLVFTFSHVSCDLSKTTPGKTSTKKALSLDSVVGYAWMPLLTNGRWQRLFLFSDLLSFQFLAQHFAPISSSPALEKKSPVFDTSSSFICFNNLVLCRVLVWWDRWETRRIDPHELVRTTCLHSRHQNNRHWSLAVTQQRRIVASYWKDTMWFCHRLFLSGFVVSIHWTLHRLISIDMK